MADGIDRPPSLYPSSKHELAVTKAKFEALVKSYYQQLTAGCGAAKCNNRFCRSCPGTC